MSEGVASAMRHRGIGRRSARQVADVEFRWVKGGRIKECGLDLRRNWARVVWGGKKKG